MNELLAAADTAVLMSIFKPIVFAIVLALWGTSVGHIDKDLDFYFLPRRRWNLINIAGGIAGFLLWLAIPMFFLGMLVGLICMFGTILGYVKFRNGKVKESERWTFDPKSWMSEKAAAAKFAAAQAGANVAFTSKQGVRQDVPGPDDKNAPAHNALDQVLGFALPRGAQKVTVQVGAEKAIVAVEVDGVAMAGPQLDPPVAMALVDYVKEQAGLDVEDRRRKQTNAVYVEAGEDRTAHLIKVTTAGSTREIQMIMLIDPNKSVAMRLEDLGLLPAQLEALKPVFTGLTGAVVSSSPVGHGVKTSLYAFINRHDPYTQSIVTLEEAVLHEVEGVTHTTIDTNKGALSANEQLAVLTRRDPTIILFPKLADVQSTKVIANSAHEIRFYLGMRQEDTFKTLRALIKAIGDPGKTAETVNAIVSGRLVRKLCETCRVPYKPDPAQLKKLNLPPDRVSQLFKHSGKVKVKEQDETCPDCLGMGYRGRAGVYEVMVLDKGAKQLVAAGQLDQLRAHLRKQKMHYLQEAALMRAVDGVTSISEVMRVLGTGS